jgi:hypothetical protein
MSAWLEAHVAFIFDSIAASSWVEDRAVRADHLRYTAVSPGLKDLSITIAAELQRTCIGK